jgi:cytoskeletal protein CcmA (bactofilin family)
MLSKKFFSLLTFALAVYLVPATTMAASVMRTGESVSVAADQVVEGDFYGLGDRVVVSGEVREDLLVAAGSVRINGRTGFDVAGLAGTVILDGFVGDDVRLVAGEVEVSGEVTGDLVVLAGSLKVLSTAKISGDLIFFGGEAVVEGEVGKSIYGSSANIRIDSKVGGDVDIKTDSLTLGDRTDITGMVKYTSVNELARSQNARVAGKVTKIDPIIPADTLLKDLAVSFLIMLFSALVWFLLFRGFLTRNVILANNHPLRSWLIGFGVIFLVPISIVVLLFSALGSLVGIILLFSYLTLIFVSISFSGVVIGSYLKLAFPNLFNEPVSLQSIVLGTVAAYLLILVPFIGAVLVLGVVVMTIGALATTTYRLLRGA